MAKMHSRKGLPPLDWLRVFEAAGRLGGFSAASREFGLTQAAISQRIRDLEHWLGRALFIRSPRGVSLTSAGESYLPQVQDALEALERSTEDLFGQAPRELRVAGLSSHLDALVVRRLPGFLSKHPDLRLMTDSVPRRSNFDDEKTWLQIRFGRGNWPNRECELLHREVLVPMAAPDLAKNGWPNLPVVEVRGERPGWNEWAKKTGNLVPAASCLSVDSMEHGLTAARQGLGIVLGSVPLAWKCLEENSLGRLPLPALDTNDGYWLTWPEPQVRSQRQRQLIVDFKSALIAGA